jgi:hypothetical protein
MRASQQDRLREAEQELQILQEWQEFTQDEQASLLDRLQSMVITVAEDLTGLKSLIARQFDINSTIGDVRESIIREGRDRQRERLKPKLPPAEPETGGLETGGLESGGLAEVMVKQRKMLTLLKRIATTDQLNALIIQLQQLRAEIGFAEFDITLTD